MKEFILLMIKGMIIGVANVIPGVSGGTLMITLGIYERLIDIISHFFKKIKKNILFVIPIGLGFVISVLIFSKVITYCLERYQLPTTLFFIGLILGGIPLLWKKVSKNTKSIVNWIIFIITFGIVTIFTFMNSGESVVNLNNVNLFEMIKLFFVGAVAAGTMIIPGISGSFVLMLLGYYQPIMETISKITDFSKLGHNLSILVPFGLGIIVGIVLIAKLIEYLIKKHEVKTYYGVLGFVFASIISIVYKLNIVSVSALEIIVGTLLLCGGTFAAYYLSEKK